ncbi:hypothetical protein [Bacillus sp. JJ722]|uniref:hypothetical protein n=1 Tax=Bacillus sp. JJ722 TaxID=3122973 RepID=UPI002FFE4DC7
MSTLDFNKVNKKHLTIKFTDGKSIMVGTPTKRQLDSLLENKELFTSGNDLGKEQLALLYDMCADLMSRNKGSVKITSDYLSEMFDLEDVTVFFAEYMKFVQGISNVKN